MLASRLAARQATTRGTIKRKMPLVTTLLERKTLQMAALLETTRSKSSRLLMAMLGVADPLKRTKRLSRLLLQRTRIQRRKYLTK